MANHKSAIKRLHQNEKRRLRNRSVKTRMKNTIKMTRAAARGSSADEASRQLDAAKSIIDKAAKKGVIHKNTAARKIARLSRYVNAAKV